MKATIYMINNEEIYTGGTGTGKTVEKAVMNAHKDTSNAWNLETWAEIDGERVNYTIEHNTATGKDEVIIL